MTLALVIANVAVFFGWQMQVGLEKSVELGGLVPTQLHPISPLGVLHLVSSMFMHGGIAHLVGNMWFLWVFGDNVEDEIGRFSFLLLFLVCGVAGAAAHVLMNLKSTLPLVGASAAISGVLGGYLVLHPRARIRTFIGFFLVRVPAWLYLLVWIGLQVFALSMTDKLENGGIAYAAHIGGFVAGLFMSIIVTPRQNPKDF